MGLRFGAYAWLAAAWAVLADTVYVLNFMGNSISRMGADGAVTTWAAGLKAPYGLALDPSGNLYVANGFTNRINRVSSNGVVAVHAIRPSPTACAIVRGADDPPQSRCAHEGGSRAPPRDNTSSLSARWFFNLAEERQKA